MAWPTDWSKIPSGSTITPGNLINTGKIKPLKVGKGGITIKGPCRIENYYFDFAGIDGLRWEGINFVKCGQFRSPESQWIYAKDCAFKDLAPGQDIYAQLGPGNDDWGFENCLFARCGVGIYARIGNGAAANRLVVLNCTFLDIGLAGHLHQDSHAIGVQEGSGHIIRGCRTENTGEAISFWARASEKMTNIEVSGCTIRNVRACKKADGSEGTQGGGIVVSGSHDGTKPLPGWRSNIRIISNDIKGCDGNGIRSNARDRVVIEKNKISQWGRAGVNRDAIFLFNRFGPADWSGVKNNTIK